LFDTPVLDTLESVLGVPQPALFISWYWYPPPPLASWNHRVRRKFWLWSLNLNDLRVRSLITNDLASISPRLVVKERRLVGLGQLRGLSWLTGTPLSCHRSISIVADGRVLCP